MIVDSSALMAILFREADEGVYSSMLAAADAVAIASPTLLEASIVAQPHRHAALDELLADNAVTTMPFTREHALLAREAYRVYGKGSRAKAQLNFGDCISYALAKATGEPLLFKGDDFTHTDIESAI